MNQNRSPGFFANGLDSAAVTVVIRAVLSAVLRPSTASTRRSVTTSHSSNCPAVSEAEYTGASVSGESSARLRGIF